MKSLQEYPTEITYGRKKKEGVVIGCLLNDILLIKDYNVTSDLFLSPEANFYFTMLETLIGKNIVNITDTDIRLSMSDEFVKKYKQLGGFATIEKLKKASDTVNFESYLDDLLKYNLMIAKYEDGCDLSKEIPIQTPKGIIYQTRLELYDCMTCSEIIHFEEMRDSQLVEVPDINQVEECSQEIPREFINELNEGSDMGIMFDEIANQDGSSIKFLPNISKEILGLKKGKLHAIAGEVNCGKTTIGMNLAIVLASKGEQTLILSNEMKIRDMRISLMSYVAGTVLGYKHLHKKRIKMGNFNEEESRQMDEVRLTYNELFSKYIYLVAIPDMSADLATKIIRKYALTKGIDCVIYDTFKLDFASKEDAGYKDVIRNSRLFDVLAKRYNVAFVILCQISQSYHGNLTLDISMLASAKQINEVLTDMIMFRNVFPQELNPENRHFINPYVMEKTDDGKWRKKEIEISNDGVYRVAFITKTRDGNTHSDSKTAYLLHFNGRHSTVKEICLCNPSNGFINDNVRTGNNS